MLTEFFISMLSPFLHFFAKIIYPRRFPLSPKKSSTEVMSAAVVNRHGQKLDVDKKFPCPERCPGSSQVLIEVVAAGVNPCDFKLRKYEVIEIG